MSAYQQAPESIFADSGRQAAGAGLVSGRREQLARWLCPNGASAGLAAACFLGALLAGRPAAGLAGFTVLGAGLAVVVPVVFTAASRLGLPGPNLALITSTGYTGMLAGPAVIGGLAEVVGLPAALGAIVAVTGMTAILAGAVRPQPAPAASPLRHPARDLT